MCFERNKRFISLVTYHVSSGWMYTCASWVLLSNTRLFKNCSTNDHCRSIIGLSYYLFEKPAKSVFSFKLCWMFICWRLTKYSFLLGFYVFYMQKNVILIRSIGSRVNFDVFPAGCNQHYTEMQYFHCVLFHMYPLSVWFVFTSLMCVYHTK